MFTLCATGVKGLRHLPCAATFDWHSIAPKTLRRMPAGEITVMVITVACVVVTHNLAIGVVGQFDYATDPDQIVIDLSAAHIWDASSVAALDAIETKYAQRGKTVEIIGLNEPSVRIHGTLSGELASH